MKKLGIKQINNLLTGNSLAVEIPALSYEFRSFIVVGAYELDQRQIPTHLSKALNKKETNDVRFWLRKYEVKKEDVERYISDNEFFNSIHLTNINSIKELENELGKYLDTFSNLDVEWHCDNPI